MTRSKLLQMLNEGNFVSGYSKVQQSLLAMVTNQLVGPSDKMSEQEQDRQILNSVGPAAFDAIMDTTIQTMQKAGKLPSEVSSKLTENQVSNYRILTNNIGEYGNFSGTLRQYLLPRYAYLDFDAIVDPRHRINEECGYPRFIWPVMYRYMYDRDDVGRRVVDIYPDESWAVDPNIIENEDENDITEFEQAWMDLCVEKSVLSYLYRIDRLCGVGHYGVLLLGLDDGLPLDQPAAGLLPDGSKDPDYKGKHKLLYLRPFDEYLSFVQQYETDPFSPRSGMPVYYNLVFTDLSTSAAGASVGVRLNRRVHWTRVIHVADNMLSSPVFGTPRMQPVFNRLLDLRKIKSGSGEMFYKGAFPGISFEIDPRYAPDEIEIDEEAMKEQLQKYMDGIQRYISSVGISAKSLAPQVADPSKHVHVQMQAIATHYGVPLRIFFGSEEGRLASSQDRLTWNTRLNRRLKTFTEPFLLRNFINRLIAFNILPSPKSGKYKVEWNDLNVSTDEDKANLSLKWTQALSQYVSSGMIHLIEPMDYLTIILGMSPSSAKQILDNMGGIEKLKKVDPSQGSGVNGKRKNDVSKGERKGTAGSRPKKRDKATKQAEGMKA